MSNKKQNPYKQVFWEFQHEGLRVRVIGFVGCPWVDIEVFDDVVEHITIFNERVQRKLSKNRGADTA